uniref:Uncharacterized protein n=1 Tax=Anguilla anguilla TaxID=7936 RepID=A0A0E9QD91_ANGAN
MHRCTYTHYPDIHIYTHANHRSSVCIDHSAYSPLGSLHHAQ